MTTKASKRAKLSSSKKLDKPISELSSSKKGSVDIDNSSKSGLEQLDDIDDVNQDSELSDSQDEVESEQSDEGSSEELDDSSDENEDQPKVDAFGTAMSAILGSKIKAHDAVNPILIRNKRPAKEIEEAREEAKVHKAIKAEKLQHKDKARIREVIPKDPEAAGDVLANEKKLRKIAQRGVVKLLNAINSAQSVALQNSDTHGASDKKIAEINTELSKEKFLDIIRLG